MPSLSSHDLAIQAAEDLSNALKNHHPSGPFLPPHASHVEDLKILATIFHEMANPKAHNVPPPRVSIGTSRPLQPTTTTTDSQSSTPPQYPPPKAFIAMANLHEVVLPMPETPLHYLNAVFNPVSGNHLEYRQLIRHPDHQKIWLTSSANEFGRLSQGIRDIPRTNTIDLINKAQVPKGRTVTYGQLVCDMIRTQKTEQARTRLTVGGNLIDYPGDVSSPTASLTTFKMHINDIVSTPDAKSICMDISNFYLNTPLPRPEFMKIPLPLIPPEIIEKYNLHDKADTQAYVYIQINKGMYGLPQAGLLANQLLQQHLAQHGYHLVRHTHGYWKHVSKPTTFVLVVDDFSVKFTNKEDTDDLLRILQQWYTVKTDWLASLYCGITTTWDYDNRTTVTLSMPGFIENILFHDDRNIHHIRTYPFNMAPNRSSPKPLTPHKDSSLPTHTSLLAPSASSYTMLAPATKILQLLDYCATNPNTRLWYSASDMILHAHSDAGYNNESNARSRTDGHLYLGNHPTKPDTFNGAILNPTHVLKHVASTAADAETGATFVNCREAIPLCHTLAEMGYYPPPTRVI